MQFSTALRNARVALIESTTGASAKLQLRTGAAPANCAAADSGTLLCEITVPADWLTAPSAGAVGKNGTWTGVGVANGDAGHYRIKDNAGTTTHLQGPVSDTSGSAEMKIDGITIATGQPTVVNTFNVTEGNA